MKNVRLSPSWFVLPVVLGEPPEDVAEFPRNAAGGGDVMKAFVSQSVVILHDVRGVLANGLGGHVEGVPQVRRAAFGELPLGVGALAAFTDSQVQSGEGHKFPWAIEGFDRVGLGPDGQGHERTEAGQVEPSRQLVGVGEDRFLQGRPFLVHRVDLPDQLGDSLFGGIQQGGTGEGVPG